MSDRNIEYLDVAISLRSPGHGQWLSKVPSLKSSQFYIEYVFHQRPFTGDKVLSLCKYCEFIEYQQLHPSYKERIIQFRGDNIKTVVISCLEYNRSLNCDSLIYEDHDTWKVLKYLFGYIGWEIIILVNSFSQSE